MRELVKKIKFVANGEPIELELAVYDRKDGKEIAISANVLGAGGQCRDDVRRLAGEFPDACLVLNWWDEYHLKKTPDWVIGELTATFERLDGKRYGTAPDLDEAPEIGGDYIDSRDVIQRLEIYRAAVAGLGVKDEDLDTFDNAENWPDYMPEDLDADSSDIIDEFLKLRELNSDGEDAAPDWTFGETMIADDYFEEYAEQFAGDVGLINEDARWPNNFIDWKAAAAALQQDYTSIEYDGKTYWVR